MSIVHDLPCMLTSFRLAFPGEIKLWLNEANEINFFLSLDFVLFIKTGGTLIAF